MSKKIFLFFFAGVVLLLALLNLKTYNLKYYFPYARFLPVYEIEKYPPKVIVYSSLGPEYIIDNAKKLTYDYGFDGFIFTRTPASSWPGDYDKLKNQKDLYRKANKVAAAEGLKTNFLKIALDQGSIPLWQDEKQWKKDLETIKNIAKFARETGFIGIAFDTEPYNKFIWHNGIKRNRLPDIEKLIERRGRQTVEAVLKGFPGAELIVFPEGHLFVYTRMNKPHKYHYWINFFNGMLNAKPEQGINLFCERMYNVTNQLKLKDYFYDIQGEIIADNVDDPGYWVNKCSISFGMWPLGREYADKRAKMTPVEFNEQFNTAAQYCPRYVWIYAHGLGWWEFSDGEKYGVSSYEAGLPVVKNLGEYQKIILRSKDENLRFFYKELKYNKKYSYLGRLLDKIF